MAINTTVENINNQPTIQPRTVTGIFTKYIAKTLPLAFDESMSYYECLCALLEYLNETIVPDINNTNDGLSELQGFYLDLQNYVNEYFDNLDVQQEINNKLDEMTESGELTEIIKNYVDPIYQEYETRINANITSQNNEINSFETSVNNRITSINDMVASVASGSPKGVYSTVSALTTADPNHQYIYVVTADGNWYYYNTSTSSWTSGGTYQNIALTTDSIKTPILEDTFIDCNIGKNKFNKNTINEGYFIIPSTGVVTSNASYFTSDFIKIDVNETYYVSHLDLQQVFVNYYTSDLEWLSGELLTEDGTLTIPSNASVLNLGTLLTKKDVLMIEIGSSPTQYEEYSYIPKGKIKNIEPSGTTFLKPTKNLVDYTTLIEGHFIRYTDGAVVDNANYYITPILKVKPNTTYTITKHTNFQVAFYDGSYAYISGTYYIESTNGQFTTPANCYYLRFSNKKDEINGLMFIEGISIPPKYIPYGLENEDQYVDENNIVKNIFYVGANERFTKIKDGIEEAIKYKGSILYVKAGTYDLYNEFGGDDFFDNYDSLSSIGLILENDIHVIFDSNAKVIFNYDGSNEAVVARFSPFNVNPANNTGGFTLENATIECTNCRYCVHDEKYATTTAYKSHYKNCNFKIEMSNPSIQYTHLGIGMGLGRAGEIIIEDCIFNTGLLVHNNGSQSDTNAKSNVIIKNNYLEHNTMYLEHCGASTLTTNMLVSNNYIYSDIVVRQNQGLYVRDNINVIDWNNTIIS